MRHAELDERLCPYVHLKGVLHREHELPVAMPNRHELAIVAEVKDGRPRALFRLTREIRNHVIAIEMHLERLVTHLVSAEKLLFDVGITGGGQQGRQQIDVRDQAVEDRAGLDLSRPADEGWYPPASLPVGVFLTAERGVGAVGPRGG